MKPFIFRLESIRRYRGYLEKKAQGEVAKARKRQREMEMAVNELVSERMDLAKRCSSEVSAGIDVARYMMYSSLLERLRSEFEDAHGEMKHAEQTVRIREEALLRESVHKKALDALRDMRLRRYTENLEKEGQKVLDELVILRRGRES